MLCSLGLLLAFSACNKRDTEPLRLDGDCLVQELALDEYAGKIDLVSRSIVVRLPENYPTSAMTLTKLTLSEGASCNVKAGDQLNMTAAKQLRVINGDILIDWTLSVLHDQAKILHFMIGGLYTGVIDEATKTISVYVPASVDIRSIAPDIVVSPNATVTPSSGSSVDFTHPVQYTVDNNSAHSVYTVTVTAIDKPAALFLGIPAKMTDLDPEAKEACMWMLANVPKSLYASFADIQAENIDLSECKAMWWHFHMDGGVDGHDAFTSKAPEALAATNQLRTFRENGGAFLLTRYATNLPSFIGVTGDDEWTTPNNCWGKNEDSAELCGGPWTFRIYDGKAGHALYQGLVAGDNPSEVYCTDKGYYITNSTAQYHIGTDWGGYNDHAAWESRTGGSILGVGGDGAVVVWEYPAAGGKGGIICIGSGCYDWYSYKYEEGYEEKYHANISIMTRNAFNHLMN